jgi:hypothetical protein
MRYILFQWRAHFQIHAEVERQVFKDKAVLQIYSEKVEGWERNTGRVEAAESL